MTAEFEREPTAEGSWGTAINYDGPDPVKGLENLPETDILVSSLASGFYLRQEGADSTHARLLADAAGSVKLPPILIQKGSCRIIDGMHRVEAAKLRGEQSIRARLVDCTDEEALVLAIKSNVLHGLPLSKADRISAAKRILTTHPNWSDRAVAEVAGLSAKTIASLRNRSTTEARFNGKRLGRDGKRRPLSAADGRRRAAAYLDAHPEAPLRQVAREADVSLGTVHDVRQRIRRGSDPVTAERGRQAEDAADVAPAPASVLRAYAERHNPQNVAWQMISAKLASDPALKYTEGGRAFLRWMASHSTRADEWREFIDAIPPHWAREVSRVADTLSAEWREFAEQLRGRQAAAV